MQYARYGKPTGTSVAAIQAKMRAKGRLPPFTPKRKIGIKSLSLPARQESKFLDTSISTLIDATPELINNTLNLVTQGDTASTRDGNVIVISSIEIIGRLAQVPAAATVSAPIVYIWLILDRQCNGNAPAATGSALSPLQYDGTNACTLRPIPANQWTFKTIKKWAIPLNSQAGVSTAFNNVSCDFSYYKKFKNGLEIRFNGNGGTISDIMSNNLFLLAACQDTDDTVNFTGNCRIRFTG